MNLGFSSVLSGHDYQVLHPRKKISRHGKYYQSFIASDGKTGYLAHAWEGEYQGPESLMHGEMLYILGKWVIFKGKTILRCHTITPTVKAPLAMRKARTRARVLMHQLQTPLLKVFVCKVFEDKALLESFMTLPASTGYHHGYAGGLFIHSVDTAWRVYQSWECKGLDKDIAVVSALLHDIAKVNAYTTKRELTAHGRHVDHDAETLLILSESLQWLETQDGKLALRIRHSLTWNPKKRRVPLYPGVMQVRFADQSSTIAEIHRSRPALSRAM